MADPHDYPLLGLKWCDVMYVDVGVPFGLKMGGYVPDVYRRNYAYVAQT